MGELLLKLYDTSKQGIRLASSGKIVKKPYYIFVVKLCSELNELAKSNTKLKEQLNSLDWDTFIAENLAQEFERIRPAKAPKKGEAAETKEESKTCSGLLFEKLTAYDYSKLADQPVEDIEVPPLPEEQKRSDSREFPDEYASNNYWRTESGVKVEDLEDEYY